MQRQEQKSKGIKQVNSRGALPPELEEPRTIISRGGAESRSGSDSGLDSSTYCLHPGAKTPLWSDGHVRRLVPYSSKRIDLKARVLSTTTVPLGRLSW